jgi:hypothetical protein
VRSGAWCRTEPTVSSINSVEGFVRVGDVEMTTVSLSYGGGMSGAATCK